MQEILINVLIFCGILLLVALIVAMVQIILIMVDIRRMTKEIKKKVYALTSLFDIVSLLFGGVEGAKKRFKKKLSPDKSTIVAFMGGLKKGLQVLLGRKGGEKDG
ncbi:hypothetical protein AMJ44_11535 [candidate division WOR-1 bacterium DG_54_3]|uniref:Uncharacterized protein n=1 Tax=candidate division WOR-1 bacterium DG_54_3 TaxID=1703775 RepID=A0A0S7XRI1_UNCSA|nr:MAG: hypothetical protein AMJ44_11535 [candidate division WOR-1 bacterium DG_54_3]